MGNIGPGKQEGALEILNNIAFANKRVVRWKKRGQNLRSGGRRITVTRKYRIKAD